MISKQEWLNSDWTQTLLKELTDNQKLIIASTVETSTIKESTDETAMRHAEKIGRIWALTSIIQWIKDIPQELTDA